MGTSDMAGVSRGAAPPADQKEMVLRLRRQPICLTWEAGEV